MIGAVSRVGVGVRSRARLVASATFTNKRFCHHGRVPDMWEVGEKRFNQ